MSPPNQARAPGEVARRPARDLPPVEGTPPARGRAVAERLLADGEGHALKAQLVRADGSPLARARYEVVDSAGTVVATGVTQANGLVFHELPQPGEYKVRFVGLERGAGAGAGGGRAGAAREG